ncbi:MAG TPA: homoserine O-acetyltransferase [Xanthomonadales bacterium]|nr:homoserine O-acetyltransferase [Xanthomonadales bacterium]
MPGATLYTALPSPMPLHRGGELRAGVIAYETWGTLNDARDNAIMIVTGMSPSAHAASSLLDPTPGWWEPMIGRDRSFDTERYFIVCVNSLGSCKGSTGPASAHPDDGLPYRLRFPSISIEDIADGAAAVARALGIERLRAVVGPSMGGMTAQAMALRHPQLAPNLIVMSCAARSSAFAIALRSLQRQIVRADPGYANGQYAHAIDVASGMGLARKLGVATYRSPQEWRERFGRERQKQVRSEDPFASEFQIESYLDAHARRWAGGFDPLSYLYLSRAMDWFDLTDYGDSVEAACRQMAVKHALVIGVATDILFPVEQQEELAEALAAAGADVDFQSLPSIQGHDAFLVDIPRFAPVISRFLDRL